MKPVFAISGGMGRVLCALPALEKYYKNHGKNFYIFSESGLEFFVGNKRLQDITYSPETKDLFETIIRPNNLITPEPYRDHGYYNQKRSLSESFDFLINNTEDHSDLERPKIYLTKQEEIHALEAINNAKKVEDLGSVQTSVLTEFQDNAKKNMEATLGVLNALNQGIEVWTTKSLNAMVEGNN